MTLAYRDIIAIVQIIVYIPCALAGLILCRRHGFSKSSGFIFLITFSLLRIIACIFRFIAISNPSRQVITAEIICTTIGMAPLTLVCLGLESRMPMVKITTTLRRYAEAIHSNDTSNRSRIPSNVFRLVNLVSLIGFIIGIVGGVQQSKNRTDPFNVNSRVQAAIIIFTLVFIVMFLIFCAISLTLHNVAKGERRLLIAVGLSCPFLLIRLIYALIADYGHNHDFNFVYGNPTIYLCMSVLEEFVIIILCVGFGLTLRALPKTVKPSSNTYSHPPTNSRAPKPATLEARPAPRQQAPRSSDLRAQNQPPPATRMGFADPPPPRQVTKPAQRKMKMRGPVTGLIRLGMDLYQSKRDRA